MDLHREHTQYRLLYIIGLCYMAICTVWNVWFDVDPSNQDTWSYIWAWVHLKSGMLDAFRTPLYPAFLGINIEIFGDAYTKTVPICQYVIFAISFRYFYRILQTLVPSQKVIFLLSLVYLCSPSISGTSSVLMTESLSISLMVMWTYCLMRELMYGASTRRISGVFVLTGALLMLRPSFVYLFVILALVIVLMFKHYGKKQGIAMLLVVSALMSGYFLYTGAMKVQEGLSSASKVSIYNNYFISRQNNAFDESLVDDDALRADMAHYFSHYYGDSHLGYFAEADTLMEKHGCDAVGNALVKNFVHHPVPYFKGIFRRAIYQSDADYFKILSFPAHFGSLGVMMEVFGLRIPFNYTYYLIVIYVIVLAVYMRRYRQVPWVSVCLVLIVLGSYSIAILAAPDEWDRLNLSVLPVMLVMLGQTVCQFAHARRSALPKGLLK